MCEAHPERPWEGSTRAAAAPLACHALSAIRATGLRRHACRPALSMKRSSARGIETAAHLSTPTTRCSSPPFHPKPSRAAFARLKVAIGCACGGMGAFQ